MEKNVLRNKLMPCCFQPKTGYYRTGFCATDDTDDGMHTVCIEVSDDFLSFSKGIGNDLTTPIPVYGFPGLKEGDKWCLCASRWLQAYDMRMAPKLLLESTHEKTLELIPIEILKEYAIDLDFHD